MSKIFFISDAHLGAESQQKELDKRNKLYKFFDIVATEGEKLFILGDFFDFWFDFKKVIFSEYFDILCELKKLSDNGIEIHFFGGNHDWWMFENGFLAKFLDAEIHPYPILIEEKGKKLFLGHGDGIAPSDWGYRNILRPILRNKFSISLFRLVPAGCGRLLSKLVSSTSKLYTEERDLHFEQEYEDYAREKLADGADFVIFGHLHLPIIKEFPEGRYVNSGDFYKHFTYLVLDDEKLEMKTIE